jgi:hypothetical protein
MNYIRLFIFIEIILLLGGCGTVGKSFDMSKVANIANDITNQSDVKKMFGEPFKTGIQNGKSIWVYEDHLYSIISENESKDLIITFNADGIVQSHQFMSSRPASN